MNFSPTHVYQLVAMSAHVKRLMTTDSTENASGFEVWDVTVNTPRMLAAPQPGEEVTLRFATWPVLPGLELFVVLERAGSDQKLPQVEKAVLDCHNNGISHWRCEVGPFGAGDSIVYFAAGNWGNHRVVGGEQYHFTVLPAVREANQSQGKEVDHEKVEFRVGARLGRPAVGRDHC